jgi:alpha-tubulin suppressor-like RCC1 family protein
MLACGKRSLALVSKDLSARACGDNCSGQLGLGRRREIRTLTRLLWSEQEDMYSDIETQMIASTDSFMAIVDTSGKVWVSGDRILPNYCNTMQLLSMPARTRIVFVATGHMHCMALSSDMRVFGAGKNWSGQLGTGDLLYRNELGLIADGPWHGSTTMIACCACVSVILTEDGALRTCGQYTSMCLGIDRSSTHLLAAGSGYVCQNINEPMLIDACNPALANLANSAQTAQKLPRVDFIAAGTQHVLAVAEGTLFSWGQNCCGQLGTGNTGDGSFLDRMQPTMIGGEDVFGSAVRVAAANEHHTLVLTEKRELWAFGNGEQGRLGLTRSTLTTKFVMSPQKLDPEHFGTGRISCIAAGKGHSAILTEDGKLYTWGQGRINEWRSPVPSALGHATTKNFQDVPLFVPPRYEICFARVFACQFFVLVLF